MGEVNLNGLPMKPIIILPLDAMSAEDMERLRANGLCVVEAKEPSLVKFLDPIPAAMGRTKVEDAAIQLSRKILNKGFWSTESTRSDLTRAFVDILVDGTPLDPRPSKQEREQEVFDNAKLMELRRLASEEARAERASKKASKTKAP